MRWREGGDEEFLGGPSKRKWNRKVRSEGTRGGGCFEKVKKLKQ